MSFFSRLRARNWPTPEGPLFSIFNVFSLVSLGLKETESEFIEDLKSNVQIMYCPNVQQMLITPISDHEHHFDCCNCCFFWNKVGYVSSGKLKWQKNNVTICWFKTYLKWKRFNCHGRNLECKSNPGKSLNFRVRPHICKLVGCFNPSEKY